MARTYSRQEICAASGMTKYQVEKVIGKLKMRPEHPRARRLYTYEEVKLIIQEHRRSQGRGNKAVLRPEYVDSLWLQLKTDGYTVPSEKERDEAKKPSKKPPQGPAAKG